MVQSPDILKILFRYLSGNIPLSDFRERLVESDLGSQLDHDARNLLNQIEGRYAEFADGLINEEFLKERFREIMNPTANAIVNPVHPVVLLEHFQRGHIVVIGQYESGSSAGYQSSLESGSVSLPAFEVST